MNYRKHDEIPAIPEDLVRECIEHGERIFAAKEPSITWYSGYDTLNEKSVAYVKPGTETDESNGKFSAGIGFWPLPDDLHRRLLSFCKGTNIPLINFDVLSIQIVGDGSFMAPHIDDPKLRNAGILFLLKAGGSNVITSWYDIKPEYALSEMTYNKAIPYSRLDIVESHRIEENAWHWLDFTKVHGVQNKESIRMAIWGYKIP